MSRVSARIEVRTALILCCLSLSAGLALAQNENETTGFQSTHAFASGNFGEDIDVLNGGLHLTMPIGPSYQVNDRLGYQLVLHYNSKVWDYSDYVDSNVNTVKPYNEGPAGIGFTLNFGRMLQDLHWRTCAGGGKCWMTTWSWITPDGNKHDVWVKEDFGPIPTAQPTLPLVASDLSYARLNVPGFGCLASNHEDPGCFTVNTPDGLTYTLGRHISYPATDDNKYRQDNESFGGWYVTRIEDRTIPPVNGVYQMNVSIEYDDRLGFEHVIKKITDGRGREIIFHNAKFDTAGNRSDTPTTAADVYPNTNPVIYNRHAIATYQVDVPAFWGSEGVPTTDPDKTASKAIYKLEHVLTNVRRTHNEFTNSEVEDGPVLELLRLDYPDYPHRGNPSPQVDTYSIYFGYMGPPSGTVNRGELTCRTLPLLKPAVNKTCSDWKNSEVVFEYDYDYYPYASLFLSGGQGGSGITGKNTAFAGAPSISSATRQVTNKRLVLPSAGTHAWTYARLNIAGFTNPGIVTVTDPFSNDTVYYYRTTLPPSATDPHAGEDPEDGIAPDWDDGLNYRVEYYKGTAETRQLLRSENLDYDADTALSPLTGLIRRTKSNSRQRRKSSILHDDGGAESLVAYSDWDKFGHWRTVSESGFEVQGTRYTHTHSLAADQVTVYVSGLSTYREVHDGLRVLDRTDKDYGSIGARLSVSVARKTLPGAVGTPGNVSTLASGDVKTAYSYDAADGSIRKKTLSRRVGQPGTEVTEYCMGYTWNRGYLKTKTFFTNCASETSIEWNAIDRMRDGNTGAIFSTTDTTGSFSTTYSYDRLGRLTDIVPLGTTELPTAIDYVSLKETTVTRGGGTDFQFSRYKYDGLGRLVREERRPANAGATYPYRETCYDIANRTTFQSEWLAPTFTGAKPCDSAPPPAPPYIPGTQFTFGNDPFGRIQQVTTADGSIATTTYKGLDSTVTVQNVMGVGASGGTGSVSTTYVRDGWNRLAMVDAPSERRCSTWGAVCTKDADCPTGQTCAATDGADAVYTYDLKDNLVQADLFDQQTNRKQTRVFEYDGLNRLYQASNPENGTVVYNDYDSLGNILSVTDASGATLTYTYDPAGRPLQVLRPPSNTVVADNLYDSGAFAKGKLSSSTAYQDDHTTTLTTSNAYMGLSGRLSSMTYSMPGWSGSPTQQAVFDYDSYGHLKSIVYPAGASGLQADLTVLYEFSNGIPTKVKDSSNNALAWVTYAPSGAIDTLSTKGDGGNSARTQITYDSQNRPSTITIGKWNGSAFQQPLYFDSGPYGYDGAGNISSIGSNTYKYDTANRLKEVHETFGSPSVNYLQCFAYDAFGNLFGKVDRTDSTGTTPCSSILTWDDLFTVTAPDGTNTNRILSQQIPGAGPMSFVYDAKGNVTKDYERRYLYDARSRMISIARLSAASSASSSAWELARYEYDNAGNRVIKRDRQRDLVTFFMRGPDGQILSEFRKTAVGTYVPEWIKHHVYLAGKEVALVENRRPTPPGGLAIYGANIQGIVNLKWRRNPQEDAVTTYAVWRAVNQGAWAQIATVTTATTTCPAETTLICYADSATTVGSRYDYQIAALAGALQSYGSDIIWATAGDTAAPAPPTCLTGSAGDGQVSLSWTASTSTDVLGYYIYRKKGPMGAITKITDSLVRDTKYVDSGLFNGSNYSYWVRALDNSLNESADVNNSSCNPSLPATFSAMPKDFAPPGPPRDVVVSGSCSIGSASVAWQGNATTDGVTKYWVYRSPDFSPPGPKLVLSPTTSFNDSGLSPLSTYYYWVVAEDGATNKSAPSQKAGVSERSTSLPVPPKKLRVSAGNGQVTIRFEAPQDTSQIASYVIYRKLNAEPSCGAFQQLGSVDKTTSPPQTDVMFPDSNAPNNLAWDYAVATRNNAGEESGFSETALAIPTSPPQNYRECTVPSGGSTPTVLIKWDPPTGFPYHPIGTTNVSGELSYLQGYHVRRYRTRTANEGDDNLLREDFLGSAMNSSGLCEFSADPCSIGGPCGVGWQTCIQMGTCELVASVSCSTNNDCVAGTQCVNSTCILDFPSMGCVQKADCPATAVCSRTLKTPTDPFLLQDPGTSYKFPTPPSDHDDNCNMVSAVYKVYANGNWQTVVSEPTSNFDPTKLSPDPSSANHRCRVKVINPSSGPLCTTSEPVTVGAPSASQPLDANNQPIPGKIHVSWNAPTGSTSVAGYQLYVTEEVSTGRQAPYGLVGNQSIRPSIALGPTQTQYDFSDLPRDARGLEVVASGSSTRYKFQVAVMDFQGRISAVSPPSSPVFLQVTNPARPMGLKTVIWTLNDAIRDGGNGAGESLNPNPRSMDGIKLQWKAGWWTGLVGFRVYRSENPNGPFCVILKNTNQAGNFPNTPICVDPTAYSDLLTRGTSEAGNTRFFHDAQVTPGKDYYYKVKSIGNGTDAAFETDYSATISGLALKHAAQPLSPPRHLKAWAPNGVAGPGIYLRWCPNPPEESVTAYKIYRSTVSGGPYTLIATLMNQSPDTILTDCLGGSRRCTILSGATGGAPTLNTAQPCTVGPGGTCKIVDLGVAYPTDTENATSQLGKIYYYVVTAMRGTEESAYSVENSGWPNYCAVGPCTCSGTSCTGTYSDRYDNDNLGSIACDDEVSEFSAPEEAPAQLADLSRSPGDLTGASAPYRTIGAFTGSAGGVGGTASPPASSRWLFFHTDHLGSPRVVVDDSGNVVSTHHYTPFGEERPLLPRVSSNNGKFTGHQRDPESASTDNPDGLDYMLARYYSSSLGRFMGPDPVSYSQRVMDVQSWNKYTYVKNNPLKFVDLLGTDINNAFNRSLLGGSSTISKRDPDDLPPGFEPTDSNYVRVRCGCEKALQDRTDHLVMAGLLVHSVGRGMGRLLLRGAAAAGEAATEAQAITISEAAMEHIIARHTIGGAEAVGTSLFGVGESIPALVEAAETVTPVVQANGNLAFIVNAGRAVGADRATGMATSVYTVITTAARNLVTAFPGKP